MHEATTSDHQCAVLSSELVPAPFHAQEKEALAHHRGLVGLRISDGKFVNHTTEMILWSMILTLLCLACPANQCSISTWIDEHTKKVPNRLIHIQGHVRFRDEISANFLCQALLPQKSRGWNGQKITPSIGGWASLTSPCYRDLGFLFPQIPKSG